MRTSTLILPAALTALLASPFPLAAEEDAMQALFKILLDRGSISQQEFDKLSVLAEKDKKPVQAAAPVRPLSTPISEEPSTLGQISELEARIAKVESETKAIEKKAAALPAAKSGDKWFDRLKLDGYTQFRVTSLLNEGADDIHVPADRSVNDQESLHIRRGRFKIYGDVSDHLHLYSQLDFAGSVFGSGGSLGLQARDLYGDISLDDDKEYRFRLGLSKVPFGFVNMQSSQNRITLERADALNSAAEGERDYGAYFMYAPKEVRERFKELVKSGLKGSGDYGMFTVGAYNGQGLNRADFDGQPHWLARVTYPWKFPNGQFFETSLQAYTGHFNSETKSITTPTGKITPIIDSNGVEDQRVGITAILYPQPFGIEAEWNWGSGPELNADYSAITRGSLNGGYILANYRLKTDHGEFFPFARWNYFDGARKFAANAPVTEVNEIDFGVEWSPWPQVELSVMYTHTLQRTNTSAAPYNLVQDADRVGFQVQWNY